MNENPAAKEKSDNPPAEKEDFVQKSLEGKMSRVLKNNDETVSKAPSKVS